MTLTRRTFLRILGIGTAAAVVAPKELLAMLPPVPAAVDTTKLLTFESVIPAAKYPATMDAYSAALKQVYGKQLTKLFREKQSVFDTLCLKGARR